MNRPNRAARRAHLFALRKREMAAECVTKCQQRVAKATVLFERFEGQYRLAALELEQAREALALALQQQAEAA